MSIPVGLRTSDGHEMPDAAPRPGRWVWQHPATQPIIAGVFGLVISLISIGGPSVWYDEAATISATTRSWAQLWEMLGTVDAVHGAYYLLIHAVIDLFGYSPAIIRMPSAIAVGAGAALTVLLARKLGGYRFALLAGILFSLMPRTAWMGVEARSYAISAAMAALLTLALVYAQRSRSWRRWALYGAVVVVATLVFNYLALIVVAHGVTMLWRWLSARRTRGRGAGIQGAAAAEFRRWFVATAAAGIALVPFGLTVMGQSRQVSWIPPLGEDTPRQVFRTQWFLYNNAFAVAGCLLLLAGVTVLVIRVFRGRGASLGRVMLPALVLPTVALLVATAVYTPLYSPRYLTMCLPFVAIVMAAGVAALRKRILVTVAMAVIIALAVPSFIEQKQGDAKQNSTWREVAELIASEPAADDRTAIIYGRVRYHVTATSRVIAYSYPDAFTGTIDVTLDTPAAETGRLWETRNPLAESLDRLDDADVAYLVTSIKRDWRPGTTRTLATVGWQVTGSWTLGDVNVLRYEPGS